MAIRGAVVLLMLAGFGCATSRKPVTQSVFYPMLPQTPRIQFLVGINDETDVGAKRATFREFVTGKQKAVASLQRPWDVAHEKGKIYVLDKSFGGVLIIDLERRKLDLLRGSKRVQMINPSGLWISPDGTKYVADKDLGQILTFDENNEFVRGYGADLDVQPLDVAVDGDRLYLCDLNKEEVLVLDRSSGALLSRIGRRGRGEGEFRWPTHLALGADGTLYVTDLLNSRVQAFDRAGNFVRSIGQPGDFPGAMPRPKGLDVDRDGHLYVVDVAFELVQIFEAKTGQVLMPFGKIGPGPGGSHLPAGIHIDYDNVEFFTQYADEDFRPEYLIYVCNQSGPAKLNVYAFGEWVTPGP